MSLSIEGSKLAPPSTAQERQPARLADVTSRTPQEKEAGVQDTVELSYSRSSGLAGQVGVTFPVPGGTDRELSLTVDGGRQTGLYNTLGTSVSYSVPQALDGRTTISDTISANRWQDTEARVNRWGNEIATSMPLSPHDDKWQLETTLRTERVLTDSGISASGKGRDWIAVPKLAVRFANIDDPDKPHLGTSFSLGAGIGTGSAVWGEIDTSLYHHIPLSERHTVILGMDAGCKLGRTPFYEQYNSYDAPPVYGRAATGDEYGPWYAQGCVKLNFCPQGPLNLVAGVTAGGIGADHLADLGIGVGPSVELGKLWQADVECGYRYNLITGNDDRRITFGLKR